LTSSPFINRSFGALTFSQLVVFPPKKIIFRDSMNQVEEKMVLNFNFGSVP